MATRTIANGGGNFSVIGTWVEGIVPVAGDSVVATATSGQLTVDVASGGVGLLSVDFTGYTNTLTMTSTLTVSGNFKMVAGMTTTGLGDLILNNTATLTSGGVSFSGGIQFAGASKTYTLADTWTVVGSLLIGGSGVHTISGAFNLNIGKNLTVTTQTAGTGATIILNGTGIWSGAGILKNSLTFNTAGTITVSGTVFFNTGTLIYTTGTMVVTSSTLSTTTMSMNTSGMTWNIVNPTSGTMTLLSNLNLSGALNPTGSTVINGAFSVNVGGSLTIGGSLSGTSSIVMNGTGTWSAGAFSITNNLIFNTAGTITISGTVIYQTGTITYTAGTMIVTSSTLSISGSSILNLSGMTWNNISFTGTSTLTSNVNLSGNISLGGTVLLNGLFNVNCGGSLNTTGGVGYGGTSTTVMTGTGSIANTATFGNLTINTAGTITFGAATTMFLTLAQPVGNTFKYIAGTVVFTGNTLSVGGNAGTAATFDTVGMTAFNNVTSSALRINLTTLLTVAGTFTTSGGFPFGGVAGFSINTWINTPSLVTATTIQFVAGVTYTITNSIRIVGVPTALILFNSVTPGTQAILILTGGSTQIFAYVSAIDIDSSAGDKVLSYKGFFSNTKNWNSFATIPVAIGY